MPDQLLRAAADDRGHAVQQLRAIGRGHALQRGARLRGRQAGRDRRRLPAGLRRPGFGRAALRRRLLDEPGRRQACANDTLCVAAPDFPGQPFCSTMCRNDADCPSGSSCLEIATGAAPNGSTARVGMCAPAAKIMATVCKRESDCPAGQGCVPAGGRTGLYTCQPAPGTKTVGQACADRVRVPQRRLLRPAVRAARRVEPGLLLVDVHGEQRLWPRPDLHAARAEQQRHALRPDRRRRRRRLPDAVHPARRGRLRSDQLHASRSPAGSPPAMRRTASATTAPPFPAPPARPMRIASWAASARRELGSRTATARRSAAHRRPPPAASTAAPAWAACARSAAVPTRR